MWYVEVKDADGMHRIDSEDPRFPVRLEGYGRDDGDALMAAVEAAYPWCWIRIHWRGATTPAG